jgi:hypothetical protein
MKLGLYKVAATVSFKIYAPEAFGVSSRLMPFEHLKQGDVFRVVRSENHGDGICRMLIVLNGELKCLKVGEIIPRVAFEHHVSKSPELRS